VGLRAGYAGLRGAASRLHGIAWGWVQAAWRSCPVDDEAMQLNQVDGRLPGSPAVVGRTLRDLDLVACLTVVGEAVEISQEDELLGFLERHAKDPFEIARAQPPALIGEAVQVTKEEKLVLLLVGESEDSLQCGGKDPVVGCVGAEVGALGGVQMTEVGEVVWKVWHVREVRKVREVREVREVRRVRRVRRVRQPSMAAHPPHLPHLRHVPHLMMEQVGEATGVCREMLKGGGKGLDFELLAP